MCACLIVFLVTGTQVYTQFKSWQDQYNDTAKWMKSVSGKQHDLSLVQEVYDAIIARTDLWQLIGRSTCTVDEWKATEVRNVSAIPNLKCYKFVVYSLAYLSSDCTASEQSGNLSLIFQIQAESNTGSTALHSVSCVSVCVYVHVHFSVRRFSTKEMSQAPT